MATLIKNHTTNQWDKVNENYSMVFGYPGQLIDFAGPAANFNYNGWLLCDGTEYNVGDYPALYAAIGNTYGGTAGSTFCVPDYRETVRVGAGQNTTQSLLATHDVYDVGQFKDDQTQRATGTLNISTGVVRSREDSELVSASGAFGLNAAAQSAWRTVNAGVSSLSTASSFYDNARVNRTGTTTHGKQVGVNTFIHV